MRDMENFEERALFNLNDLKSGDEFTNRFDKIADKLLKEYRIRKGGKMYDILEIEFYYYSDEHPDIITYPRFAKAGHWYFHMSGVDIAFESNCCIDDKGAIIGNGGFGGGILIRSIKRIDSGKTILGPMNCVNELFDMFDALKQPTDFPVLVLGNARNVYTDYCQRWIPPFNEMNKKEANQKCASRYRIFAGRYNRNIELDWNYDKPFINYLNAKYRYFVKEVSCISTYSGRPKEWGMCKPRSCTDFI